MKLLWKLLVVVVFVPTLSCQTMPPARNVASVADSNPFAGNKGTFENPVLNEEYALPANLLSNRSPIDPKSKRPYLDFVGRYGLVDKNFSSEDEDFADQVLRIHVIQLLNQGVLPSEIKALNAQNVDLTDLAKVQIEINKARAQKSGNPKYLDYRDMMRGFHAKAHGCLEANFKVFDQTEFNAALTAARSGASNLNYQQSYGKSDAQLYSAVHQGLFTKPTTYRALVRYSNGTGEDQDDHATDVRGLAVKLLGRADGSSFTDENGATTQDFLMTNKTNAFGETSRQFVNFAFSKAEGPLSSGNLTKFAQRNEYLKTAFAGLLARHTGFTFTPAGIKASLEAKIGLRLLGVKVPPEQSRPVTSLATETFWSGSPYHLGPQAIKFQVRPALKPDNDDKRMAARDYLRNDLIEKIKNNEVVYTFYVQLQSDPVKTPVEDTLVPWQDQQSPPIPVAELRVFKGQDFTAEDRQLYCQNLSFNPWHHFTGHKPMSNLNRGRQFVYKASSAYRHGNNAPAEPMLKDIEDVYGPYPAN